MQVDSFLSQTKGKRPAGSSAKDKSRNRKRARSDDLEGDGKLAPFDAEADGELDAEAILKLVDSVEEDADVLDVITETTLKRMVLDLERKFNANIEQRMKNADNPELYLESEIDLDEELKRMRVIATAPDLYPLFVELGALKTIVGLLAHENLDIVADVVELFQELLDADEDEIDIESHNSVKILAVELIECGGLDSLVQNFQRYDEEQSEESQAVYNTLGICEALADIDVQLFCDAALKRTKLLDWCISRVSCSSTQKFNDNMLYASEVLAILLSSPESRVKVSGEQLDSILQSIAVYRKEVPTLPEEEEMLSNLFDSLCALVQISKHSAEFVKREGMELCIRILKSKKQKGPISDTLKLLDFALENNIDACNRFIDGLGLSPLFSLLKKNAKGKAKGKGKYLSQEDYDHLVAVIASLCQCLYFHGAAASAQNVRFVRLMKKVEEQSALDKLTELRAHAVATLKSSQESLARECIVDGKIDIDAFYVLQLDNGLSFQQSIDCVLAHFAVSGQGKGKSDVDVGVGVDREGILHTLRQWIENIEVNEEDEGERNANARVLRGRLQGLVDALVGSVGKE